jgi:hypothetical protein
MQYIYILGTNPITRVSEARLQGCVRMREWHRGSNYVTEVNIRTVCVCESERELLTLYINTGTSTVHYETGNQTAGTNRIRGWVGTKAGGLNTVVKRKIPSPRRDSYPLSSSP